MGSRDRTQCGVGIADRVKPQAGAALSRPAAVQDTLADFNGRHRCGQRYLRDAGDQGQQRGVKQICLPLRPAVVNPSHDDVALVGDTNDNAAGGATVAGRGTSAEVVDRGGVGGANEASLRVGRRSAWDVFQITGGSGWCVSVSPPAARWATMQMRSGR